MDNLVEVSSSELKFDVVLNAPIVTQLVLKSKVDHELAFKVKTTVPKRYVVRPNAGVLQPHAALEIEITMESVAAWPADMATCKDKFLLQVAPLGDKGSMASTAFWSAISAADIVAQKFKVFLSAPTAASGPLPAEPVPTSSLSNTSPSSAPANPVAVGANTVDTAATANHVVPAAATAQVPPMQKIESPQIAQAAPPPQAPSAPVVEPAARQETAAVEVTGLRERPAAAKVETSPRIAAPTVMKSGSVAGEETRSEQITGSIGISPIYSILMFVISLVFIKLFI